METSRRGMGMVGSRRDKTTTTAAISTVPSADTQKLDFILETLHDQKNLVETLGSDIKCLKSEVTVFNEKLDQYKTVASSSAVSQKRRVPNEISVSLRQLLHFTDMQASLIITNYCA